MNRVKYVRKIELVPTKVRAMCVRWDLYTRGDVAAYNKMFDKCAKYDGKVEDLAAIAGDILEHSDAEMLEDYGCYTIYEMIALIMGELERECTWVRYTDVEYED